MLPKTVRRGQRQAKRRLCYIAKTLIKITKSDEEDIGSIRHSRGLPWHKSELAVLQ
jgi:hypothetical protein